MDVFLEFPCFSYDPTDVASLISGSPPFSKFSLCLWKFLVHILLRPNLKDFEHYLASMWNQCNCAVVWIFFGIALLWDWNQNWPFLSLGLEWKTDLFHCSCPVAKSRLTLQHARLSCPYLLQFSETCDPWIDDASCGVFSSTSIQRPQFFSTQPSFWVLLRSPFIMSFSFILVLLLHPVIFTGQSSEQRGQEFSFLFFSTLDFLAPKKMPWKQ